MKLHSIYLIIILLSLTSCITTTNVHYNDPNYLNSDEFSTYEEITKNTQQEEKSNSDTTTHYNNDNYYDYHFSSRIRRFHRPMHYSGYYNGLYTDYYWYNSDPLYCGTSLYYGHNWHSPYYSYYSYTPYHNYYNPYYANYYSYYGYNYYHPSNNIYYNNTNNHNAYITGNRRSLATSGRDIKIKPNKKKSTLNIRANHQENNSQYKPKNHSTKAKNKTFRETPTIKRNLRNNSNQQVRTNSNKRNSNQFSNSRNNRVNSQNRSGNRKRNIKPRK